jgi:hypothetical protein
MCIIVLDLQIYRYFQEKKGENFNLKRGNSTSGLLISHKHRILAFRSLLENSCVLEWGNLTYRNYVGVFVVALRDGEP